MSNQKNERLLILGKSGSGKDFLMRNLAKLGLIVGLKTTSRPIRYYEKNNVQYDFISNELFLEKKNQNEFLVSQSFNILEDIWYYGITKSEFERAQVFIITPDEFLQIDKETRKRCFVVYLDIDRDIREERVLRRRDMNDSIKRRFDADDLDFEKFSDYDLRITDPDFTAQDVYDLMD
jgi:guanylate kinase